jgi:L-serine dehydratase
MYGVFQMFKIGIGPSSSHTVGPMKAAKQFLLKAKSKGILDSDHVKSIHADLYGSLALTGKGHATDKAIIMGLKGHDPDNVDTTTIYEEIDKIQERKSLMLLNTYEKILKINFLKKQRLPYHTNGMTFYLKDEEDKEIYKETFYSVGGGFILNESEINKQHSSDDNCDEKVPYFFKNADELFSLCEKNKLKIHELMLANELVSHSEAEVRRKLDRIWEVMNQGIIRGMNSSGCLPGPLQLNRRAPLLLEKLKILENNNKMDPLNSMNWLNMWALAVSEENSTGGQIVTAPTNGAAGVIPAVIKYYLKFYSELFPNRIHDFLLTAAAIGSIFKRNATISGAEGGCQAEIGVASSMAAAALTDCLDGNLIQVENAAEIAMEHFIGLTCDPVGGVVQIPCIERNAIGAVKAVNATALALSETNKHKVSLDRIVHVMKETGNDMKTKYKETSKGGIAKILENDFKHAMKLMKDNNKFNKLHKEEVDMFQHNTLC